LGCLAIGTVMKKRNNQRINIRNINIFNDNQAYNQPERYGRSPQYGRQINVEEKI
jgi:nucleoid DNA-binding protein